MAGGGKLVVGARHRVEDRARRVAAEVDGAAGRGVDGGARRPGAATNWSRAAPLVAAMLADQGDRRLDFRHGAHVAQQLVGAAEVLPHGKEQRQPAPHVGVDVGLAMLDVVGVDQLAVDPVAADGLHVVRVGLDAQGGGGVAAALRRRGHLAGLDEPQPGQCRRSAGNSRRKHSPSRSLRRTISCCRLCHLFGADELVQARPALRPAGARRPGRRACASTR